MTRETALRMVSDMWAAAEKRMLPRTGNEFWVATGLSMGVAIGVLELYEMAKPHWDEMYQRHQQLQEQFLGRFAR